MHTDRNNFMSNDTPVITSGLTKSYGEVTGIEDISITVGREEIFGLIGPDGSGKTTLLRVLATLLLPDSGDVSVEGMDVCRDAGKLRKIIGYMPGSFSLYSDLSVEENLRFFAAVFDTTVDDNYELIKPIYSHIEQFSGRRAGDLSGGMKQKLALSCALVHRPRLLLLDEPNTGVDAVSRSELWNMLFELREKGITIMVSTPYMDEAGKCERVALMQKGRMLTIDSPDRIVDQFPRDLYMLRSDRMRSLGRDLKSCCEEFGVHRFGDSVHFSTEPGQDPRKRIREHLQRLGHSDIEISRIRPTIEDSFIELMGRGEERGNE